MTRCFAVVRAWRTRAPSSATAPYRASELHAAAVRRVSRAPPNTLDSPLRESTATFRCSAPRHLRGQPVEEKILRLAIIAKNTDANDRSLNTIQRGQHENHDGPHRGASRDASD